MDERLSPLTHKPPEPIEDPRPLTFSVQIDGAPTMVEFRPEFRIAPGNAVATGEGIVSGSAIIGDRTVPAVLKEYRERDRKTFENAVTMQQALHEAGLRGIPLVAHEDLRILSLNVNHSGYVALSSTNTSDIALPRSIERIDGFEEVVTRMCAEVIEATEKGYLLPSDAYFLLIDRNLGSISHSRTADFFIGDFDFVRRQRADETHTELFRNNVQDLAHFLSFFISTHCTEPLWESLRRSLVGTSEDYGLFGNLLTYATKASWIPGAEMPQFAGELRKIIYQ